MTSRNLSYRGLPSTPSGRERNSRPLHLCGTCQRIGLAKTKRVQTRREVTARQRETQVSGHLRYEASILRPGTLQSIAKGVGGPDSLRKQPAEKSAGIAHPWHHQPCGAGPMNHSRFAGANSYNCAAKNRWTVRVMSTQSVHFLTIAEPLKPILGLGQFVRKQLERRPSANGFRSQCNRMKSQ